MADFVFVLAPIFLAWWFTGWPGKNDPVAVKCAGLSFVLFGASMLLRLVIFGRTLPAHQYTSGLLTAGDTIERCVYMMAAGVIVLLVYSYFLKRR